MDDELRDLLYPDRGKNTIYYIAIVVSVFFALVVGYILMQEL